MEKYLYFRTQATIADDDDSAQSACFPLSSFVGMHPTADDALTLFFKPQIRNAGDGQDGNVVNNDSVILTVGTNDHKDAMQALIKALYKDEGFNVDGADNFVVVADDLSTNTKYLVSEVTAVGTITIAAALS
tara:strand:+ start:3774 stop:4169 length:396 start_codon:yes stop_codon:yes gene_type:complete